MGGRIAAVILSAAIIMTSPALVTTTLAAPKISVEMSKRAIKKTSVQPLSATTVVPDESIPEILADSTGISDLSPDDTISSETEDITAPDESSTDIPSDSSDVPTETESNVTVPDDDISEPDQPDDSSGTDDSLPDDSSGKVDPASDESTDVSSPDESTDESVTEKTDESVPEQENEQETTGQDESTDSAAAQTGSAANGADQNQTAAGRTSERVITIPSSNSGSSASQSTAQAGAVGRRRVQKKVQEYTLADTVAMTTVEKVKELNVRTGKGTNYSIAGRIRKGGIVFLLSSNKDDEWLFIETEDAGHHVLRGYVKSEFLTYKNAEKRLAKLGDKYRNYVRVSITEKDNSAFGDIKKTVYEHVVEEHTTISYEWVTDDPASTVIMNKATSADRKKLIDYAMQFLGNPYVWGGESLTNGCDCSGFTMLIYRQFGIELPRCSYEQAEVGTKIAAKDALPGDLLFYERDGTVYHVLIYIGNGQAINASSSTTGIIISNVDYDKTCWGVRMIEEGTYSSTQAADLVETGKKAYLGDKEAQQEIISKLATATEKEWAEYGFLPSVLIAQVIQESGWLSFSGAATGGIQPEDNNILGMNEELLNDKWISPWTGNAVLRNVPQWDGTKDVYGLESMRTYEDMEACLADYAAFKVGIHPEIANEKDVDTVIDVGLKGYATDPTYQDSIREIVKKYDLTQYDVMQNGGYAADPTNYTQEELELIWAIVAQEDDTSYEGALAVISSAMNRADRNYGGYGTTALEQLTADGQYCYSPKVSDPSLYQRRLGGNVDDFVIKAVSDCLTKGIRNNDYLNFRSSNRTGAYVQIGDNWYF